MFPLDAQLLFQGFKQLFCFAINLSKIKKK